MVGLLGGNFLGGLQGPLGTLSARAQENPYALLALGLGLLSGQNTGDAFGKGLQGLLAGSEYDYERSQRTAAEKAKQAQLAAISNFIGQNGTPRQAVAQGKWAPRDVLPPATQNLLRAFPDKAAELAFSTMIPKPGEPYTLGPGDVRYGSGNQPVASNPKPPEGRFRPLTNPAERALYGIPPNDPTPYQIGPDGKVYQVGGSNVAVTTNIAGEKAWDTESAKLFAQQYNKITTEANKAQEMLGLYDLAASGLDTGVRTGAFGSAEQDVRRFGLALGIGEADKVAGGELIAAVQNRLALIMRNPDSGMGMPGAVSDRDLVFLKEAQIGLDRSPEGNKRMLEAFRRLEQRKIEIAKMADAYIAQHGRLDAGFNGVVRKHAEENPLFTDLARAAPATTAPQLPPGVVPYTEFFR